MSKVTITLTLDLTPIEPFYVAYDHREAQLKERVGEEVFGNMMKGHCKQGMYLALSLAEEERNKWGRSKEEQELMVEHLKKQIEQHDTWTGVLAEAQQDAKINLVVEEKVDEYPYN